MCAQRATLCKSGLDIEGEGAGEQKVQCSAKIFLEETERYGNSMP